MKLSAPAYGSFVTASLAVAQTFPITGITSGVDAITGARPFRQDIEIFQNSGPAWDLYIQALQAYEQVNASQLLSYFQVAGIHGYPNAPWDGVQGDGGGVGYCAHNTVTFPTWHRPYMALFEQIIWGTAQTIAQTYPDSNRDLYVAATQSLRIPYWDWSVHADIPAIVSVTSIQINTPSGQETVDNPLYNYVFPPAAASTEIGNLQVTTRGANANQMLTSQANGLHTSTYNLYANQPNYAPFANAAYLPPNAPPLSGFRATNSLEHIHNIIHETVGGQMADLTVAAFDPLFWLHHANVDRIFAIWEALYPNQFTVPWNTTQDDYVIPAGTTVDKDTPLYPFHSDSQGTLFTSVDVRTTKAFGYTYPEVVDWGMNSDSNTLRANVTAIVNQIYNPSGNSSRRRRGTSLSAGNAASYNWVVGVVADKSLLKQSLTLHFYASTSVDKINGTDIISTDTVIGTDSIIVSRSLMTKPSSRNLVSGQTFITPSLLSLLPDLNPSTALPFLTSKLHWRARFADGSLPSAEEMRALAAVNITLMGQTITQTPGLDRFPIYGEWVVYGGGILGAKGWAVL